MLLLLTVIIFGFESWWMADLVSHFTLQYVICSLVAAIFFGVLSFVQRKRSVYIWCALSMLMALIHGYSVATFFVKTKHRIPRQEVAHDLRIMSFNVLAGNKQYQEIQRQITQVDPDIVLLLEVQRPLLSALERIGEVYPYHILEPRSDSFGMALYSKYPIVKHAVHSWGVRHLPWIEAEILSQGGQQYMLYGVHTLPPVIKELGLY
jgi:endonuclease/exonuclease/phosphatase (EEP) superfamily protein YafD